MPAAMGTEAVAAVTEDGKRKLRRKQRDHAKDPDVGQPRMVAGEEVAPGQWNPDLYGLPPECPIEVLGMDGDTLYVVDALGQLAGIADSSFGQKKIQRLFLHRVNYLYWAWPRFGQKGRVTGFDTVQVVDALYKAAGRKGAWSPHDRLRGRGGWSDRAGNLVLHCGDAVYVKGREQAIGQYESHFYPRRPSLPEPWARPVSDDTMDGTGLWAALSSFTFERGRVDALLLLGWMAATFLGGALGWRPMVFVVGDRGVGKSSLQTLIKGVLGDWLIKSADTTAAGIYQRVGEDSLPVAVDELEAGADNSRVLAVIKLARLAASGDMMMRGGSNHTGTSFRAYNCFLFSAINRPPVPPQDLSRMALLTLMPRDPASAAERVPVIDTDVVGRMVLRRLVDNWQHFPELYALYRAALGTGGHDGRGQDTYGTLLACAHLVLGDDLLERYGLPTDADGLNPWGQLLAAESLAEREDASENWRRCLSHLLTSRVEAWRNGLRQTVGSMLEDLRSGAENLNEANRQLAQADLYALPASMVRSGASGYALAVPNSGPIIAAMFKGTDWGGDGGAGVWAAALRQAPPAVVVTDKAKNKHRINGMQRRCTIVMVDALDA